MVIFQAALKNSTDVSGTRLFLNRNIAKIQPPSLCLQKRIQHAAQVVFDLDADVVAFQREGYIGANEALF